MGNHSSTVAIKQISINTFWTQAMSTFLLEKIGQHLWGFKPRLMAHFVKRNGSAKSLGWFARNMPVYERILKSWGPIRTHLVSTTASIINGCAYCTFGHAYSFQLHYLKNTGKLFPLNDEQLLALSSVPRDQIIEQLCIALTEAGLQEEIPIVHRTNELMRGSGELDKPSNPNSSDKKILHLISMFAELNACGIEGNVEPDEAHDPINKDTELKKQYAKLRAIDA